MDSRIGGARRRVCNSRARPELRIAVFFQISARFLGQVVSLFQPESLDEVVRRRAEVAAAAYGVALYRPERGKRPYTPPAGGVTTSAAIQKAGRQGTSTEPPLMPTQPPPDPWNSVGG